jgi:hypothetical protein
MTYIITPQAGLVQLPGFTGIGFRQLPELVRAGAGQLVFEGNNFHTKLFAYIISTLTGEQVIYKRWVSRTANPYTDICDYNYLD